MDKIEIFTDGACSGNPGPGGWGAILRDGSGTKEISGGESYTTNNRMELTAVIKALEEIKIPSTISITTDSEYVKKGITQWIKSWVRNNWLTSQKKEVKNKELWQKLLELTKNHDIDWHWVRGHSGHPENERCDKLANNQITLLRSQK